MKRIILFVSFLFLMGYQGIAQVLEPVKWTFDSKQDGQEVTLIFKAVIDEGWHLYDTNLPDGGPVKTTIHYADSTLFTFVGEVSKDPQPTEIFDKTFNLKLRYFTKQAVLTQKIRLKNSAKSEIRGSVEFMSCNDETCTPPTEAEFAIHLNAKASKAEVSSSVVPLGGSDLQPKSGNLLYFLFFSFLAGLAAILTPCVFPMIPMTVSFFMNSSGSKREHPRAVDGYTRVFVELRQVVSDLEPRRLGADEDVLCRTDGGSVYQRPHGDVHKRAVSHHREEEGSACPASRVVEVFLSEDGDVVQTLRDRDLLPLEYRRTP